MDFNQKQQDNQQNERGGQAWDRWNSNASHSSYYNQPTHPPYDRGFAIATLVMGLLSFTSACCGFSLPISALGILFAVLCKRKGKPLDSTCKAGLVLCILALLFQFFFLFVIVLRILYDPAFLEQLNQTSQAVYGMDFTDMLRESFGPLLR